jgi:hypothetical protein
MVDIQTFLEAFLTCPHDLPISMMELFLVYCPQVSHYQALHIIWHCINRILLYVCMYICISCILCKKFLIPLQFKATYLTYFYSRHMQTQHMASRCHCEVERCNRRLKLFISTPTVIQEPCLPHGSSSDRNYIVLLCIRYDSNI